MFIFKRLRSGVATLAVFALLASVLVAIPAVAADPKADYKATFDACVGNAGGDGGFEDVPASHGNAGDINCIAYYGITKGTGDGTTYSPLMSVSREHMALFLMRLAARVGIDVNDDPADPGFTDTGDLSEESQMAIAQLADLGITKGTSATTYAPADNVSRGEMALFISRLMDKMSPQADGEIGLSSTTQYGYTPSDVVDNDMDASIGTPFGDISGSTPKEEYDAVTQLYELGVAAGVSDTSYAP
ncbi:MAG: S-layer homology domain-containing protein, partial [Caldilineaceae bacterium]|nr:S-layer homology domain-containing protein [Caldilineaceae bacterium]